MIFSQLPFADILVLATNLAQQFKCESLEWEDAGVKRATNSVVEVSKENL